MSRPIVVEGGNRFWDVFMAVAEGRMRDAAGLSVSTSSLGMISAVGVYPRDEFMATSGEVAAAAAKVLPEHGTWKCLRVRVKEAVITEVSPSGNILVHVESVFTYEDTTNPDRVESAVVSGNSRAGLRAWSAGAGTDALRDLFSS